MKTTTLLAFLLLLALTSKPQLGAAGPAPEQVVDTSGKIVRIRTSYYIVPYSPNVGGTLSLNTTKDCPLDVVAVDDFQQGLPLIFTPVNVNKGVIRVHTDLNIYFPVQTSCPQSTAWKLGDYDYATGQWFVTTGGSFGNPGPETIGNWFKIEKYEDAYKLAYCPSVCNDCNYPCMDIGIYEDQYGKRLALNNYEPFKVQFMRA